MKKEAQVFSDIFRLLRGINIQPVHLAVPVSLGLLAAIFEGVSVGMLIPLLNGFLVRDFSFVKEAPYIGNLVTMFPDSILKSDRNLFIVLMAVFVVAVLLKNILKYLSAVAMAYFANRAMHHLRKVTFGRYLSFGKLYFDRSSVGHHATVLMQFTEHSLAPVINITKYMNALFSLVASLIVMSLISWKLTLFALPLFFVLHLVVRSMIDRVRLLGLRITERGSALGRAAIEILSTIPLVKSYGTESQERQHFAHISDEKARFDFEVRAVQEFMLPMQEVITLFAAMALFIGMLWLMVRGGQVSAPPFIVYFYLILNSASKFGTLTGFRSTLARAHGPLHEMKEVFEDQGKFFVRGGVKEFTGLREEIAFQSARFRYEESREILQGMTLTIPKGKITAIVGPTGGGKTTLVNLLLRYYDCEPGMIFIDGVDIRAFSIPSLLTHIALVSQDTLLLHDTLRRNISYGLPQIAEERLRDAVDRARLRDLIEKLPNGLETLIGDRGVKLSGGEKQRVAIARALLKNAEILILDEATSSLDSQTEALIQEAIDEAIKGRTAIVIAHRLSTIRHADGIAVIDDGRCIEHGTLQELLARKGKFSLLWEQQRFD